MISPIEYAIGRQLSAIDRRPLGLIDYLPSEGGYDGGFSERVINEAIDATLVNSRHRALWKNDEGE